MKDIKNIILIGSGNIATQLGIELKKKQFNILQVYSRTLDSARVLAKNIDADFTNDIHKLQTNADLYIVAITDNAVKSVVSDIFLNDKLIIHTSGSLPIQILKNCSTNFGSIYPVQTFTKESKINFKNLPLCLEATNDEACNTLTSFAKKISDNVQMISFEQKKYLHIAAVFANNFSNFMFNISEDILKKHDLSFDLLKPLIQATADKIATHKPSEVQTGPAVRKDLNIIKKHLELLNTEPNYKEIYELITKQIIYAKERRTQNNKL